MNIISNTCLGAYITRDFVKEIYQNPFQWNIIDYASMKNLIENYDSLHEMFYTAKIEKDTDFVSLYLANKILIQYVHIKPLSKSTVKNQNDIFIEDNHIIDYTLNKFKMRISRCHEDPFFILHFQPHHPISGNRTELLKFYNTIESKYPIIIITDDKNVVSKDNILVFHLPTNSLDAVKNVANIIGPIIAKHL